MAQPVLCTFEVVKFFKTGFSVKCPKSTAVQWTKDEDEDLRKLLAVKRETTCRNCIHHFALFLQSMGGSVVWQ
jgi:hypothetical protein